MSLLEPIENSKPKTSSSHDPTAALRPRGTKRLLPGLDGVSDDRELESEVSASGSPPQQSPYFSRVSSPIPSKHPSRSSSRIPAGRTNLLQPNLASTNDLGATISDIWGKSWTSLQGMASNVLGSDASSQIIKDKAGPRPRVPQFPSFQKQWGPKIETTQPGAGTNEERREIVRAKKRQELLDSNGSVYVDPQFRYKRRMSDDFESMSAPPVAIEDRDALVYLHVVKPEDTLAGISIKFNCQLSAIKQANRMWSNDGIQFRKVIIVPVDACNVKGCRVSAPNPKGPNFLISPSTKDNDKTPTQATFAGWGQLAQESEDRVQEIEVPLEEPLYQHDSWIQLEGNPGTIEIARLPRRDLGYFPRPRRKSLSFSDFNSPRGSSSFELPRPGDVPDGARKGSLPAGANPFRQHLIGPGGVGKLGGKGPSLPGPSDTKLNKVITKHMPGFAPPVSAYDDDRPASNSTGLENVGSAIEGWVKRIAKSAAKAVEAPPQRHLRTRIAGMNASSTDLIELENTSEVGSDFGDEPERERGRPYRHGNMMNDGFGRQFRGGSAT